MAVADELIQEQTLETRETEPMRLDTLAELLKPNDALSEDQKKLLSKAAEQIVELIQSPITNPVKTGGIISSWLIDERQKQLEECKEAYEFFYYFCEYLSNPSFNENVKIGVYDEIWGGTRIVIYPDSNDKGCLGRIGENQITHASIVIRTGEGEIRNTSAQMQLNFRFVDGKDELASLRVDLHEDREEIQVDAQIGTGDINKVHQQVLALETGNDRRKNFALLLNNFIVTFVEDRLADEVVEGRITQLRQNISLVQNRSNGSDSLNNLQKAYSKARVGLGIGGANDTQLEETAQLDEVTAYFEFIQKTAIELFSEKTIQEVANAIRLNSLGDYSKKAEELADFPVVLNWLLHRKEMDELTPKEALKIKDRIVLLRASLELAKSGELPVPEEGSNDNATYNVLTTSRDWLAKYQDDKLLKQLKLMQAIRESF